MSKLYGFRFLLTIKHDDIPFRGIVAFDVPSKWRHLEQELLSHYRKLEAEGMTFVIFCEGDWTKIPSMMGIFDKNDDPVIVFGFHYDDPDDFCTKLVAAITELTGPTGSC